MFRSCMLHEISWSLQGGVALQAECLINVVRKHLMFIILGFANMVVEIVWSGEISVADPANVF
jgi:hypothetical protein